MSSSDGKWADTRMLEILRRAVKGLQLSYMETVWMDRFLEDDTATLSRHPSHTGQPSQGRDTVLPLRPAQPAQPGQWSEERGSDSESSPRSGRPDRRPDAASSTMRTSLFGGSSGVDNSEQSANTGLPDAKPRPQASPPPLARRERSPVTHARPTPADSREGPSDTSSWGEPGVEEPDWAYNVVLPDRKPSGSARETTGDPSFGWP